MKPRLTVFLAFLAFAVFFWIANRGAYKAWFDGDDLDNLAMTRTAGVDVFTHNLVSPKLDVSNFRPVGHGFYRVFGTWAGLEFPRYIAAIHAIHLVNVILLWLLLRGLGFTPVQAGFGVLLFGFHMGTFEIYWKPMYVFDLLCATFSLATLLLWIHNRWILALVTFWLAFKSKEAAVALPAVLALLEWTLGTRRWLRLVPFFAVSINFGVQGMLQSHAKPETEYTFHFTGAALLKTLAFYGDRVLVLPYAGALLAALFLVRDRFARFGTLVLLVLIGPLLFLPGRLFGPYLYVPLIGLAIAGAALSRKAGLIVTAVLALIWVPVNFRQMQQRRNDFLPICAENHAYMDQVLQLAKDYPETRTFLFDKSPEGLHSWGVRAAVRYAMYPVYQLNLEEVRTKEALAVTGEPALAVLNWDPARRKLHVVARNASTKEAAYIVMDDDTPLWQLGDGWHGLEGKFQWTNLDAYAHVARPAGATRFEVVVNIGPLLIEQLKKVKLEVFVDDQKVGEQEFEKNGWSTLAYRVPATAAGSAKVHFKASPGYFYEDHNPADALGVGIGAFGFKEAETAIQ